MEQFLKKLLIATQVSLSEADFICRITNTKLNDKSKDIRANQQKLICDIESSLSKMRKCRPFIDPLYFAAMCVISNDDTIELVERAKITSRVMQIYGLLSIKTHKEAWNDILNVANDEKIPIDKQIVDIINKTISDVGGSPKFEEFL